MHLIEIWKGSVKGAGRISTSNDEFIKLLNFDFKLNTTQIHSETF